MKKYIKAGLFDYPKYDKFRGYKVIKSCTRELRSKIENPDIRKYVTSIYLVADEDSYNYELEDYETYYYLIFFKEDTVKSIYEDTYINHGTAAFKYPDKSPEWCINDWLKEYVYLDEWNW